MPEETNTYQDSRVNRQLAITTYQLTKRIRIIMYLSFVMLFLIISVTIIAISFNYDGVTQKERVEMVKKDTAVVLALGLTGNTASEDSNSLLPLSAESWQKEIIDSIGQAFKTNEVVADEANFAGKTYQKQTVMLALSNRYMTTLQKNRDYKIKKLSFDKYHNATVIYTVKPINLVNVQRCVLRAIDQELKKNPDDVANLTESELRLIEYALFASNWGKVVGKNCPTSPPKNSEIELLYTSHFLKGRYHVTKETLNTVLHTGLSE